MLPKIGHPGGPGGSLFPGSLEFLFLKNKKKADAENNMIRQTGKLGKSMILQAKF